MNQKLIAAAVAAVVVAPVASYGESSFYGRINNAIDSNDLGDDSSTDISGVASRLGFRGDTDIGNGLTAHGRYEFSTVTDNEGTGIGDTRIATVGLSGAFGRVDVGNQWSAYFNTFGTLVSPTYSLGYYLYSSIGGGPFRASNTIKYSNDFGPLHAELDVRLNEDGNEGADVAEKIRGDGFGIGLSFAVTDNITIAASFDSEDREDSGAGTPAIVLTADGTAGDGVLATIAADPDEIGHDEDRLGLAVKGNFGGYSLTVGWQNYERDGVNSIPVSGTIDLNDNGDTADTIEGVVENNVDLTVDAQDEVDTLFVNASGSFSEKTSWLLSYSEADDGISVISDAGVIAETDDSTQFLWAVYHNLGGGMRLYYEATDVDSENAGNDGARHLLGMRIDF